MLFYKDVENSTVSDFPNMVRLDIYEFLNWMIGRGVPKDIKIAKITGIGSEKHSLYLQKNPKDSTYQTQILIGSNQGMVYIDDFDISISIQGLAPRTYRYIDCSETAVDKDEQFTHIPPYVALSK